ncbi:MAG: ABC transporter permease subunit [Alphaproteobacteria bacterium]|nr:ABC transporter permease subunit [Alphaproteobacteria bacterium]
MGLGTRAVALPLLWLCLFLLAPLLLLLKISLAEATLASPPFTPLLVAEGGRLALRISAGNYGLLFGDPLYRGALLTSLRLALAATAAALAIGLPLAYAMARSPAPWRRTLLLLVILPFWTSFLIRVYAWMGILGDAGLLNALLEGIGLIQEPLRILGTEGAIVLGIAYAYLPFMVLPLYASLRRLAPELEEAAADLGCRRLATFWLVILPLARPGIVAGALLVFIPALGEFVIPDLLGGPDTFMLGRALWDEFFANRDWPLAAAIAILLLALVLAPLLLLQRQQAKTQLFG